MCSSTLLGEGKVCVGNCANLVLLYVFMVKIMSYYSIVYYKSHWGFLIYISIYIYIYNIIVQVLYYILATLTVSSHYHI